MTHTVVKAALQALAQPEWAVLMTRYFKTKPGQYGAGDQFLGLSMPQQHAIARQFGALALAETEQLLHDPYHECRMTALLIWVNQVKPANVSAGVQAAVAERYLANWAYINNWDLVDVSCPHILGQYLLHRDRSLLYELARQSQRIALVSTLAFIRLGQFADTFAIAGQLLGHTHDLIHKTTGWMLCEVGKCNPEALEKFLHDHGRQMPRTALRYAIERFHPARRRHYLDR